MPHVVHLLRAPVPDHALAAIERQSRDPANTLTVVLRENAHTPPLPDGVRVHRLVEAAAPGTAGSLSYSELLELIFAADQVISW